jgi:hypothetical protein
MMYWKNKILTCLIVIYQGHHQVTMRPAVPPLMSQPGLPTSAIRLPVPGGGQTGIPTSLIGQPPGNFATPPFDPRTVMPNIRNPLIPGMQVKPLIMIKISQNKNHIALLHVELYSHS